MKEIFMYIFAIILIEIPFCITGICCAAIYKKEKLKTFSIIGIITSIMANILYLLRVFDIFNVYSSVFENNNYNIDLLLTIMTTLSISLAHISMLLLINNKNIIINIIKKITIIASIILYILILKQNCGFFSQNPIEKKLTSILIILTTLSTCILLLWHFINKYIINQHQKS